MVFQRIEIPDSEDEPLTSSPAQLPLLERAEAPLATAQASQDAACEGQACVTDAGRGEADRLMADVLDAQKKDAADMQGANGSSGGGVGAKRTAAIAAPIDGHAEGLKPDPATDASDADAGTEMLGEGATADVAETEVAKSCDGIPEEERDDTAASKSQDPATASAEEIMHVHGIQNKKESPALEAVSGPPVLTTSKAETVVNDQKSAGSANVSPRKSMEVDDTPNDDTRNEIEPTAHENVRHQPVLPSSEADTTAKNQTGATTPQPAKESSPPVASDNDPLGGDVHVKVGSSPETGSTTVNDAVQAPSPRGESALAVVSATVENSAATREELECPTNAEENRDNYTAPRSASDDEPPLQEDVLMKGFSPPETGNPAVGVEAQFLSLQGGNTPAYTHLPVEQSGVTRDDIKPSTSAEQKTDASTTTKRAAEGQPDLVSERKRALQEKPEETPRQTAKTAPPARNSQEATVAELKAQRTALIAALAALPNIQETIVEANDAASHTSHVSDLEPSDADIMAAASKVVKKHIKLLHEYNEIKDVGQGLMGLIADQRGVRIVEIQDEFGIGEKD